MVIDILLLFTTMMVQSIIYNNADFLDMQLPGNPKELTYSIVKRKDGDQASSSKRQDF
jgi:hypothetical protein